MKVSFDKSLRFIGLGVYPWTRLGLEKKFNNYSIISAHGWDLPDKIDNLQVLFLKNELAHNSAQCMVEQSEFRTLLHTIPAGAELIPYKPIKQHEDISSHKLIQLHKELTEKYENKRWFREKFSNRVNFPNFEIKTVKELKGSFQKYNGKKIVLQDESLSGGRGTYLVKNKSDFDRALFNLEKQPQGSKVIVSDFIDSAVEASVQCCVTRQGVLTGPSQRQLVMNTLLCDVDNPLGDKFCGAQIGAENGLSLAATRKMSEYAKLIGEAAAIDGYKGIFGVDYLVRGDDVYVLEMNARVTGVTPLLTMFEESVGIPFYLLHVLEISGKEYEIEDLDRNGIGVASSGSMLILHAHNKKSAKLVKAPASGVYSYSDGEMIFKRQDLHFTPEDNDDDLLLQQWAIAGSNVRPGGRLTVIFSRTKLLDNDGNLTPSAKKIVKLVYKKNEIGN